MTKNCCPRSGLIVDKDLFAEKGGPTADIDPLERERERERKRTRERERERVREQREKERRERERGRERERERLPKHLRPYLPFQP